MGKDVITNPSQDLTFDEPSLAIEAAAEAVPITLLTYDMERDFIILHFEQPASAAAASYALVVSGVYAGEVRNQNDVGFYRDYYFDPDTGEKVYLAVTQFETNDARDERTSGELLNTNYVFWSLSSMQNYFILWHMHFT